MKNTQEEMRGTSGTKSRMDMGRGGKEGEPAPEYRDEAAEIGFQGQGKG